DSRDQDFRRLGLPVDPPEGRRHSSWRRTRDDSRRSHSLDPAQAGRPVGARARREPAGSSPKPGMSMKGFLALRSLLFLILIPGTVAGYVPLRILRASGPL